MGMEKVIEKALEYDGPIERYKQSGQTIIYLSKELKEDKNIVYPDNFAHTFFLLFQMISYWKKKRRTTLSFQSYTRNY